METVIDGNILMDFFRNQPKQIPFGTEEDNNAWNSFWSFLKSKTDLDVRNFNSGDSLQEAFLKGLTTGRGDSKISLDNDTPIYNDGCFSARKPSTLYCLYEGDENNKKALDNKNGYVVAFQDNYTHQWERLSLLKHNKTLSVREDAYIKSSTLKSWDELEKYLTKFTDVVIVDNYIFSSDELIPSNFEKILIELSKATPVKFNLTIYTFEGRRESRLNGKMLMRKLNSIVEANNINCNIQLALAFNKVKEHDRGIFTNYLRIKSGDSFNYFNSKGEVITSGTDIDFHSMTDPNLRAAAKNVLHDLNNKLNSMINAKVLVPYVYGECENMLLTQFD